MRPQTSIGFGENVCELNDTGKATFFSPTEAWVVPAPSSKKPEERIRGRLRSINAHAEPKKKLSLAELETLHKSRNSTTVIRANGEVKTSQEAQVHVPDLELSVTVKKP